ncbi:MAG: TniB family NTP-binding protein [Terriglobia bacterium]
MTKPDSGNSQTHGDIRPLVDATDAERIRQILTEHFVCHRRAKAIIEEVKFLMYKPVQTRAWGLVIEADPGQGKTLLAEAIHQRFPPREGSTSHAPTRPVVCISMTGAREARTIHTRVLAELGTNVSRYLTISEREQLTLQLLHELGVQLLILDEAQDVLRTTRRQREAALDAIKLMMNTLHIPILALGTQTVAHAFREDPHLAARFRHHQLPRWKADHEFAALLRGLQSCLPLREQYNLARPALMRRIIELTEGSTAQTVRLVTHAAVFALLGGIERIGEAELERAATESPPAEVVEPSARGA